MDYNYEDIARMIDHSLLNPSLTDRELEAGCRLAADYHAVSVCIMPYYLKRCAEILRGSTVKPGTTIGFPHGGHSTAIKVVEARQALDDGGEELDLNDAQKIQLCEICGELGADWVKTSTGYGTGGATEADVRLMRQHSPAHVQVKAAGGVRDLKRLLVFRALGVTRIGASRTAEILEECKRRRG
jgi:deoxyribose-phosphate aldolase